jgi:hypothetical protein
VGVADGPGRRFALVGRFYLRLSGPHETESDRPRLSRFETSSGPEQGNEAADLSLVVPPVAAHVLEGRPVEEVLFARDEMANMVWGVERTISLPSGAPKPGREAAEETLSYFEQDLERRPGAPPYHRPSPTTRRSATKS